MLNRGTGGQLEQDHIQIIYFSEKIQAPRKKKKFGEKCVLFTEHYKCALSNRQIGRHMHNDSHISYNTSIKLVGVQIG